VISSQFRMNVCVSVLTILLAMNVGGAEEEILEIQDLRERLAEREDDSDADLTGFGVRANGAEEAERMGLLGKCRLGAGG
jgi:hypothetical protein